MEYCISEISKNYCISNSRVNAVTKFKSLYTTDQQQHTNDKNIYYLILICCFRFKSSDPLPSIYSLSMINTPLLYSSCVYHSVRIIISSCNCTKVTIPKWRYA